jgi:LPXTG-motif cell wall-anchored protein
MTVAMTASAIGLVTPDIATAEAPTLRPVMAPVQLPRTGIDVSAMLRFAALLAAGGAVALVTSRRRKRGMAS